MTARSGPRASEAGRAWTDSVAARQGEIDPALHSRPGGGLVVVGLAAAISWIDWRWVLLALSAAAVVLPCGLLALRGRLDLFEPLTWFALMFLLLFVLRPAWDLWHENFIYTGRLISPTFTKMLVAGLLAGTGFVIGYLTPAGDRSHRGFRAPGAGAPPSADLVDARLRGRPCRLRDLLRRGARVARPGAFFFRRQGRLPASPRPPRPRASTSSPRSC